MVLVLIMNASAFRPEASAQTRWSPQQLFRSGISFPLVAADLVGHVMLVRSPAAGGVSDGAGSASNPGSCLAPQTGCGMRSFRAVGQSHPATGRSPSGCGTSVSLPTGRGPRLLVQVRRSRFDVDGGAAAAVWTLSGVLSALTSDWPKQSLKSSSSRSCPPVLLSSADTPCPAAFCWFWFWLLPSPSRSSFLRMEEQK